MMVNLRTRIGIIILVLFSLYQSIQALNYFRPFYVWRRLQKGEVPTDFITIYRKQIACLLPYLSPDEVVGFYTTASYKKDERWIVFHSTQYVIAPVVLDDSINHELVIAFFPKKGHKVNKSIPEGLTVKNSCTDEVYLLERE
jgi:hypothetical protein